MVQRFAQLAKEVELNSAVRSVRRAVWSRAIRRVRIRPELLAITIHLRANALYQLSSLKYCRHMMKNEATYVYSKWMYQVKVEKKEK
jgi:hypothetical protein